MIYCPCLMDLKTLSNLTGVDLRVLFPVWDSRYGGQTLKR